MHSERPLPRPPRTPLALHAALAVLAVLAACRSSELAPPAEPRATTPVEEAVGAPTAAVEVRPWEHESSDIPLDPRVRVGHLANGLRFAWADNPRPEERCYVRLHVDVGSLAEREEERGMAHFLEHLAFNGSENFEPGTLIEWFQEHGMAFGADTNAHTAFSETVYKLDLPQSDEATLREGLLVLRDFADRLLIEEEEVENEKGVIDGEQRERDSAGFRLFVKQLEEMYAGTRLPERIPIGVQEVRDEFTARSVRSFYERWYRPDNMTLVLVGDLQGLDPEPLFREYFADMPHPGTPLPVEPDPGEPRSYAHFFSIHEEEVPSVTLVVERLKPWEEEPVTVAEWQQRLPLDYARRLVNLRFRELAKREEAPFLGASLSDAASFEVYDGESLTIGCAPDKWREALAFCEQELRRALEFGFQQAELDEVRADSLRALDEAVQREPTAPSQGILAEILAAAEDRNVPTDAATNRAVVRPALEALTIEVCHEALREAWTEGELCVYALGNLDLGEGGGRLLAEAWNESAAVAVEAGEEIVVQEFAYSSNPEVKGSIVSRQTVEDLGFEQVVFENGVAVNLKRTEFKEQQILVNVTFGEGQLTLEPERSVLDWVAARVFNGGGLEAHSEDELRRLLAGKTVGLSFSASPDSFVLGGSTTAEDLLLQCELACAYLSAPGWRQDGRVQLMRTLPLYFEGLEHQHQGPFVTEFLPSLFSNDPRQRHPELEEVEAVSMEDVREWLAPHLASAPIEVAIVGDIEVEETLDVVARTFGTLPGRRTWRAYEERRDLPTPVSGLRQEHEIDTQIEKSLVILAFPLPDGLDPTTRRRGQVLKTVVDDRLRLEVRERLGAAYSPGSAVQMSRVHPGVGLLFVQAMSDPGKVETLLEACLQVAESLATEGVTQEEADRLREPMLKSLRDAKRTNGFWLGVLTEAQRDPSTLDDVRTADDFYASFTAEQITPLAREHLGRDKASILVVHPAKGSAQEASAPAGD